MKKTVLTILTISLFPGVLFAQKLADGIQALYYQKYRLAQNILEKVVSGNPKDGKAAYWLGQVYLQNPDKNSINKTQALYQSSLNNHFNDPFLLVGMGALDLLTGNNIVAAKQKFDEAALTSKNNPEVLNAIGRANALGSRSTGDPAYAIELLKKAAAADPRNPETDYYLAINYLKLVADNSKPAIDALLDATKRDPKYAKAFFELGKIYQSQGDKVQSTDYFQKAVEADPNYAPAYLHLSSAAVQSKNYSLSEYYLKKYIGLDDYDYTAQYYLAYVQLQEGNRTEAQRTIAAFLSKTPVDDVDANAYRTAAEAYIQYPDSAKLFYTKAFGKDTSYANRIGYADSLIRLYATDKDSVNTYLWTKRKFETIPAARDDYKMKNVLPQLCLAATKAIPLFRDPEAFGFIDSVFQLYIANSPQVEFGYYGRAKIALQTDSSLSRALVPVGSYISFLEKEKSDASNKAKLVYYYDILGQYFANAKKDYQHAAQQYKKILAVDPTNARARDILAQLVKMKAYPDH